MIITKKRGIHSHGCPLSYKNINVVFDVVQLMVATGSCASDAQTIWIIDVSIIW